MEQWTPMWSWATTVHVTLTSMQVPVGATGCVHCTFSFKIRTGRFLCDMSSGSNSYRHFVKGKRKCVELDISHWIGNWLKLCEYVGSLVKLHFGVFPHLLAVHTRNRWISCSLSIAHSCKLFGFSISGNFTSQNWLTSHLQRRTEKTWTMEWKKINEHELKMNNLDVHKETLLFWGRILWSLKGKATAKCQAKLREDLIGASFQAGA